MANAAIGQPAKPRNSGEPRARNVIFLVSDGLSIGALSFVDQFRRYKERRSSHWISLYGKNGAVRGLMDTASLNSLVPDSAAAAAAWGSGQRVNNGSVNIGPNGEIHAPILLLAKEAGKSVGLVTTATVSHATPAAFAANVPHRNNEPDIARQYFERRIDLVLGGGRVFFDGRRPDGRNLLEDFAGAGYQIANSREELLALAGGHGSLIGTFADNHLPFELDRLQNKLERRQVPSLEEMTRVALDRLNRNPDGFVIQIEGARIDMAAHANDIAGLVYDQIAFDDAVGAAIEFAEKEPDTLLIVTTDHGNANPGLNSGDNGGESNFKVLAGFKGTHGQILDRLNIESSAAAIRETILEVTGVEVSMDNAELLRLRLREEYRVPYRRMNGISAVLGQVLANHTDIGWIGNSHTSDHVEVAAFGPGSERIRAFQKNTALFSVMTEAIGIFEQSRLLEAVEEN